MKQKKEPQKLRLETAEREKRRLAKKKKLG
jgi:hypothetical protein